MTVNNAPPWILHVIPNTHWDREWYLSFERYRLRLVELMDRMLDLLERDSEFKTFTLDGQYIPIKDYLELRPERQNQIIRMVRAGRLLVGPWYTQPLETMSGGEGLVRNLMLGIGLSQRLGAVMKVSYIIDQFGHVSQLPQILRGFDIASAVAWRGVSKNMPSVFHWQSPDGSSVLFCYSNRGYGEATALPESTDDFTQVIQDTPFQRDGLRKRIESLLKLRTPNATTPHLLALNGIDHSYVQEDLTSVLRVINQQFPHVRALHSNLNDYIHAVQTAHAQENKPYQTCRGELLDDYEFVLQPIHSFRSELKIANDRLEGLLVNRAEPLAALAWVLGKPYPHAELNHAWELLLQNHAHDSIGCASVDSVYRDIMNRYERAEDVAGELITQSIQWLTQAVQHEGAGKPVLLMNCLGHTQTQAITAEIDIPHALAIGRPSFHMGNQAVPGIVESAHDKHLIRFNPQRGHPSVIGVKRSRVVLDAGTIPPMGYQVVTLSNGDGAPPANDPGLTVGPATLENQTLRVTVEPHGGLTVLHKPSGRQYTNLNSFEDSGENGTGYDYIPPVQDRVIRSGATPAQVQVIFDSPLKATLRVQITMALPAELSADRKRRSDELIECTIISLVSLARGSSRLDIQTTVDNRVRDHRFRVLFPTQLAGATHACAEQPFEVVARPIAKPTEPPRPNAPIITTKPQQSFVDVSDGVDGLMIANKGLYEYEVIDDASRTIALTLLRCTDHTDGGPLGPTIDFVMPLGQCPGLRTFEYSIIPHRGSWESARHEAWSFKHPVQVALLREPEASVLPGYEKPASAGTLPMRHSFLHVEPESCVVSCFKKHESRDTLIVRLWNSSDQAAPAQIALVIPGRPVTAVWETNLNEERRGELTLDADGKIPVTLAPHRVFTMEIQLRN